MKKQALLTAMAGLLTFTSVAVLPAFAQDTGGQTFKPMPRQEYSRSGGHHEQHHGWGSGNYGYRNHGYGSYGYGYGSYGKDKQDKEEWRGQGGYGRERSKGYGGYGYRHSGYGSDNAGQDRSSR